MAFEKYDVLVALPDTKGTHWMDPAPALRFLRRAVEVSTPAVMSRLDLAPYAEQVAATRALFQDIGSFYAYMNTPPQSDPLYVDTFRRWFGIAWPLDRQARAWKEVNGIGPSAAGIGPIDGRHDVREFNVRTVVTQRKWVEAWERLRGTPWREWLDPPIGSAQDQQTYNSVTTILRLELNQLGHTIEQCVAPVPSELCGRFYTPRATGCAKEGATSEGCGEYTWKVMSWDNGPLLFPLRWYFEFAADLALKLLSRTDPLIPAGPLSPALAMVSQSLRYVFMRNLKEAEKYHVLPADLAALAANIQVDMAASQQQVANQTSQTVGTAFALATTVATAVNPIAGAVVGLVGAIATLVTSVLPYAIGAPEDEWGRPRPIFLAASMTADRTGTPTHALPPPLPPSAKERISEKIGTGSTGTGTGTGGGTDTTDDKSGFGLGTFVAIGFGGYLLWRLLRRPEHGAQRR